MKTTAVKFRHKVYVAGPRHKDALDLAFATLSDHQVRRVCDRVAAGKEDVVFGLAEEDGSGFEPTNMQNARKLMYGLD